MDNAVHYPWIMLSHLRFTGKVLSKRAGNQYNELNHCDISTTLQNGIKATGRSWFVSGWEGDGKLDLNSVFHCISPEGLQKWGSLSWTSQEAAGAHVPLGRDAGLPRPFPVPSATAHLTLCEPGAWTGIKSTGSHFHMALAQRLSFRRMPRKV